MSWWDWSVNKALHYPLCCMKNLYNSHTLEVSLFICYNYLFKLTCILAFKLYLLSTAAIILCHLICYFRKTYKKNISDNVSTSFPAHLTVDKKTSWVKVLAAMYWISLDWRLMCWRLARKHIAVIFFILFLDTSMVWRLKPSCKDVLLFKIHICY